MTYLPSLIYWWGVYQITITMAKVKKDPVLARINRIEGQIAGIKRMYEAKRACTEIVQQIQASRAALGNLAGTLLSDEAKRCVDKGDVEGLEKIVNRTFKTL